MNKEKWKNIPNLDGYQVSNLGRIKFLGKKRLLKNKGYIIYPEKILKTRKNYKGYTVVWIRKKNYLVHRIVAQVFIPNPNNYPCVLHKKSIRNGGTNCVDNLYWGTYNDNVKDTIKDKSWYQPKRLKYEAYSILQYNLEGKFIKQWNNYREIPFNYKHIYEVCNGKRKTANGYIWKYGEKKISKILE